MQRSQVSCSFMSWRQIQLLSYLEPLEAMLAVSSASNTSSFVFII